MGAAAGMKRLRITVAHGSAIINGYPGYKFSEEISFLPVEK